MYGKSFALCNMELIFKFEFKWAILKNDDAEREAEGLIQTVTTIREVRELCKLNKAESNGN